MSQKIEFITAGAGSIYEILLIVLVVILIFNGLLRQKIMHKVNDSLDARKSPSSNTQANNVKIRDKKENHEYVDYEEIKDN